MKFRDPTLVAGSRETLVAAVGEPVRRDKIPNWLRLATIRRLAIPRDQHTAGGYLLGFVANILDGSTMRVHAWSTAKRCS